MTNSWSSLTGRERDATKNEAWVDMDNHEREEALAILLGWKKNPEGVRGIGWVSPVGQHILGGLPSFTISLDAMRLAEEEIERRGLQVEYSSILKDIVAVAHPLQPDQHFMSAVWRLIHAGAAQRAEAAYKVLSAENAVRATLTGAGLSAPAAPVPGQLSPEQRDELARRVKGKPLSEIIIEERGE